MLKMVTTGVTELDVELRALAAEEGAKSINAAMRKIIGDIVKQILVPKVKELIPYDDGRGSYKDDGEHLEDQLVVRVIKRSRTRVGYYVGFPHELFKGPTYYGGYIEFGWDHRGGFHVEADSFLRRALYPQADTIIAAIRTAAAAFIAERNRAA